MIGRANAPTGKDEQAPPPVDPDELVRTIAELGKRDQHLGGRVVLGPGLPLVGVMRVLFPPINQPNEDVLAEESNEEKQQRSGKDPIRSSSTEARGAT